MIPTNSGRDDIDTWPGEHYKKAKMKARYIGKLQAPELEKDIEADRAYIAGMKAGWNYGVKAGYLEAQRKFALLGPGQGKELYDEIDRIHKEYDTCIENRLKEIREARKSDE